MSLASSSGARSAWRRCSSPPLADTSPRPTSSLSSHHHQPACRWPKSHLQSFPTPWRLARASSTPFWVSSVGGWRPCRSLAGGPPPLPSGAGQPAVGIGVARSYRHSYPRPGLRQLYRSVLLCVRDRNLYVPGGHVRIPVSGRNGHFVYVVLVGVRRLLEVGARGL